jgi:SAM-dependent MidA family methyltransferase
MAVTFRQAWQQALYGPDGFYRQHAPADHFRTSVHASPQFAAAIVRLAQQIGTTTITDIGAGRGELAAAVARLAPEISVVSIELDSDFPQRLNGLVIANEWLDNIPCEVVVMDDGPRYVLADGSPGPVVEGNDLEWLSEWWPLDEGRAEIGLPRDQAWAEVVGRLDHGTAIAIDYGHVRDDRPPYGTLTGYRNGRECAPEPDGSCDITAHVALDSVAAAVGGTVTSQRDSLRALGIDATRPDHALATSDPQRYLAGLSAAGEAAELLDPAGLGGFAWIRVDRQ